MKKEIFDKYAHAIAEQFHLTLDEMFDKSRRRDLVDARQLLFYLCLERPIRVSYVQKFMEELTKYKMMISALIPNIT